MLGISLSIGLHKQDCPERSRDFVVGLSSCTFPFKFCNFVPAELYIEIVLDLSTIEVANTYGILDYVQSSILKLYRNQGTTKVVLLE